MKYKLISSPKRPSDPLCPDPKKRKIDFSSSLVRPRQYKGYRFILDTWETGAQCVLLNYATGTGKTVIGLTVAAERMRSTPFQEGKTQVSVFTSPCCEILEQAARDCVVHTDAMTVVLEGYSLYLVTQGKLEFSKINFSDDGRLYGHVRNQKITYDTEVPQRIMLFVAHKSIGKVVDLLWMRNLPRNVLVVDEGHHAHNGTAFGKDVDGRIKPLFAKTLYMSATAIPSFSYPTISYPFPEAMREAAIPSISRSNIHIEVTDQTGVPNWNQMMKQIVNREPDKNHRILIFGGDSSSCKDISAAFNLFLPGGVYRALSTEAVAVRQEYRAKISDPSVRHLVLVTEGMFGEGYNMPEITHVIFVVGPKNPTLKQSRIEGQDFNVITAQRIGRLFRSNPDTRFARKEITFVSVNSEKSSSLSRLRDVPGHLDVAIQNYFKFHFR